MKATFLDIDGVIMPEGSGKRFNEFPNRNKIITELSEKHNIDYFRYPVYDVLGAYCDWNKGSIKKLKYVLDATGSMIIVSSGWRNKYEPNEMHDLLEIHGLGEYWYADNEIIRSRFRIINNLRSEERTRRNEIIRSLRMYPIENFLVLDNMSKLKMFFRNNCVITHNYITDKDREECVKILNRKI